MSSNESRGCVKVHNDHKPHLPLVDDLSHKERNHWPQKQRRLETLAHASRMSQKRKADAERRNDVTLSQNELDRASTSKKPKCRVGSLLLLLQPWFSCLCCRWTIDTGPPAALPGDFITAPPIGPHPPQTKVYRVKKCQRRFSHSPR